jgi:hypothetical protein
MKTGKFTFGFAFIAVMAAILSGCFSLPAKPGVITIDPNHPKEESAVLIFPDFLYIKEYNGIDVESEWYPNDKLRKVTATIPAGDTHLLFDVYMSYSRGNTTYTFRPKDMELKFNFEAGKEYTVSIYASKNIGNFIFPKQKIILAIWDRIYSDANPGNTEESHIIKSWELSEF